MSKLDTNHVVNLDLVKDRVNSVIKFGLADVETSDFYLGLYNNGSRVFDKDYIVTLYIVKPNGTFRNIELEPKVGLKKYYCNLPDTLKNIAGEYVCQVMVFDNLTGEKKISKSKFKYSVSLDLASEMAGIIDEEEQESILTNVLNRLLTLENPVEPYATQKHVDECVSTLTEEIDTIKVKDVEQDERLVNIESKDNEQDGRLTTIETKDVEQDERLVNIESKNTEQDNRLTSIEAKDVEQDGRLNLLENQVDGIDEKIVNTIEPSLDNHGNRLDALETKDTAHELRMTNIESKNTKQDNRLNSLENKDLVHESRMTDIESKNTEQDERLSNIEAKNTEQDNRLNVAENRLANIGNDITNTMQPIIDGHTSRLDAIEAIDVAQNTRLDAIEVKNQQQDDRLLDIEKVNNRQDIDIKCLYGASQTIDIAKEGNSIYLQNSNNGFAVIDEIQGNTMVNCNKEPDKELILNGNINTSGDGTVTITEGADGGLVDIALEGNTMVNVCDQKDPVAITKSYTVKTGNHVALQGEYDGKCRPVVTGNTLVNLYDMSKCRTFGIGSSISDNIITFDTSESTSWEGVNLKSNIFKTSTQYTFIITVHENTIQTSANKYIFFEQVSSNTVFSTYNETMPQGFIGVYKFVLTTRDTFEGKTNNLYSDIRLNSLEDMTGKISFSVCILEGDYTNKPIPGYFEGLQSSFEDKIVTQEMVDNGEELAENLGKYKVDYVISKEDGTVGFTKTFYLNSPLLEGDTIEQQGDNVVHVHRYGKIVLDGSENWSNYSTYTNENLFTGATLKPSNCKSNGKIMCEKFVVGNLDGNREILHLGLNNFELSVFTTKLSTQNLIGLKQYLQANPVTVVYELTNPQYEVISQNDSILCDSYTNGHLDVDSVVPIEKVGFLPVEEELTYLYPSTQYAVQFNSDKAITADITLGGTSLLAQSIVKGLNKITITTPATLANNKLVISGVGANISEVVVTDTDREFGYFEGMKSVGECEELEIMKCSKNLFDLNNYLSQDTQTVAGLTLTKIDNNTFKLQGTCTGSYRIFNNIKQTYKLNPNTTYVSKITLIEGVAPNKGLVSIHCESPHTSNRFRNSFPSQEPVVLTTSNESYYLKQFIIEGLEVGAEYNCTYTIQLEEGSTATEYIPHQSNTQQLTHEPLRAVGNAKDRYVLIDGKWYIERKCGIRTYQEGDQVNYKTDLINTVYPLQTITYKPIDYNPLEVYSGTTHITTNSTIPTNIIVKNHGFNCLLKPNTIYTISSNLGLNTVTTPSTLTEDCLRFMDTDTSDVTTMKDVLVLEGDWTTKANLIPANFSGIESAFEQEYDEAVGKYKVKAKVVGKNLLHCMFKDLGTDRLITTDKIHFTKGSTYSFSFEGLGDEITDFQAWLIDNNYKIPSSYGDYNAGVIQNIANWNKPTNASYVFTANKTVDAYIHIRNANRPLLSELVKKSQLEQGTEATEYEPYKENYIEFYIDEPLRGIGDVKDRVYVKDDKVVVQRNCGQRAYQDGDFGTYLTDKVNTVYQLAEPTYEEVQYDDVKLFIESFKNSTLFYNSNVPVTSTVHYSYSVPLVDKVAQTANISDQQDSMIIDLATQCAVMEIMLM